MTPFETYFAEEWPRRLAGARSSSGVFSDGGKIDNASWDRKAAYLLWQVELEARGAYTERMTEEFSAAQFDDDDLIGGGATPADDEEDDLI